MKRVRLFCKIVSVCFFIFYTFPACRVAKVRLMSGDITSGTLMLVDSKGRPASVINAMPKEKIKWIVGKSSQVTSIQNMNKKDSSQDVLSEQFHKKGSSTTWEAKVASEEALEKIEKIEGKFVEEYYIDWTDSVGQVHRYDPKIQINPR